jgi:type II secretory pathway component GspD/PulD (secretin)
LFGNTTQTHDRTELIALITPRLIEDIDQAHDLTEELKSQLKSLRKDLRILEQKQRLGCLASKLSQSSFF